MLVMKTTSKTFMGYFLNKHLMPNIESLVKPFIRLIKLPNSISNIRVICYVSQHRVKKWDNV